jgi:hypothetical protein
MSDGRVIELQPQTRDRIRYSKAVPFLKSLNLSQAERDTIVSVRKAALTDILKQRAPPYRGAAAIRKAMAALREVDAVDDITLQPRIKVTNP